MSSVQASSSASSVNRVARELKDIEERRASLVSRIKTREKAAERAEKREEKEAAYKPEIYWGSQNNPQRFGFNGNMKNFMSLLPSLVATAMTNAISRMNPYANMGSVQGFSPWGMQQSLFQQPSVNFNLPPQGVDYSSAIMSMFQGLPFGQIHHGGDHNRLGGANDGTSETYQMEKSALEEERDSLEFKANRIRAQNGIALVDYEGARKKDEEKKGGGDKKDQKPAEVMPHIPSFFDPTRLMAKKA